MHGITSSRALLFAATAAAALAAEGNAPAPAAPPAPREDSINATRRDLDLIKSSRDGASQPAGAVPKFTVPEIQAAPSVGAWTPQKPGQPPAKKSANWLLDAMEKKQDGRKATGKLDDLFGPKSASREKEGETELDPKDAKDLEPGERKSGSTEEKNPRREEPVFNPLTRFMSDWMTPQDLALMKPVMEARAGGDLPGGGRVEQPLSIGTDGGLSTSVEAVLGVPASKPSFAAPTVQENPYLQAMTSNLPVAGSSPANAPAPIHIIQPASNPMMTPLPPPAPPRSNIPDFAKPATDEKYFKQLKRF